MDDLISRQAAIDAMLGDRVQITNVIRAIGNKRDFEVLNATCDRHAGIIKNLPSAQPERKKGKWIKNDNGTYSCNLCHSWIPNEQRHYARYCLFCGTEMEETDDESEIH